MKKALLFLMFQTFLITLSANAQTRTEITDTIPASYPGGDEAFLRFISEQVNYPTEAVENEASGTVYVSFVVTERGTISRVKIFSTDLYYMPVTSKRRSRFRKSKTVKLTNGHDFGLSNECIRVIKKSPNWTPATVNGDDVATTQIFPIKFQIF